MISPALMLTRTIAPDHLARKALREFFDAVLKIDCSEELARIHEAFRREFYRRNPLHAQVADPGIGKIAYNQANPRKETRPANARR